MSIVAIDIDDTLYDFGLAAREECLRRGLTVGAYGMWLDWRGPRDAVGEEEWLDIIAAVHADESIAFQEPFPGAVAAVNEIHEAGHGVRYVTTRSPDAGPATAEWLENEGFPQPDNLICSWDDKQKHIHDCMYLIDDRPKTVVQFVYREGSIASGRKAFVKAQPYNHNLTDVPGIYVSPTWAGIRHYLEKKGVLPGV